jgi:hypothetical protein
LRQVNSIRYGTWPDLAWSIAKDLAYPDPDPISRAVSVPVDYLSNRELLGTYVGQFQEGLQTLVQGPLDHLMVEHVEDTQAPTCHGRGETRLRTYTPPILPTPTPIKLHYYNNVAIKMYMAASRIDTSSGVR